MLNISEIINDLELELLKIFNNKLSKIFLYGSYARDDFSVESDVDFIGIVNLSTAEIEKYEDKLVEIEVNLSLKYDKYISILIRSVENFNKYSNTLDYYKNIISEGVVLYESR